MRNRDHNSSTIRRLVTFANIIWPAALVFIAYDLSVDPEVSVLRGPDADRSDLEIVSIDHLGSQLPPYSAGDDDVGADPTRHIMFGMESVAEELALAGNSAEVLTSGGWAGNFAGLLDGDIESNCWSPFEVNLRLRQDGERVYGPGSYLVDPSKCSSHEQDYLAFFVADGTRDGDRVTLEIKNEESGEIALLFSGVVADDRLVGVFTGPTGVAVSGATILTLVDEEEVAAES